MTFDDELILFVDITFDGFMDTTDLQIRAIDKNGSGMTETYENVWTLNPRIIETVYQEPTSVWSDVIHISDDSVNYSRSGIGSGNTHLVSLQAVLGAELSEKSGKILITDSKDRPFQSIHFKTDSKGVYDGFIGLNKNWIPDTYTINMKIGDKVIEPVTLEIVSDFKDEQIINVNESVENQSSFTEISHSDVSITNSQDKPLISVSGFIDESKFGVPVLLSIHGNDLNQTYSSILTDDGNYNILFSIDPKWKSGEYDLSVNYYDYTWSDTIFVDNVTIENAVLDLDVASNTTSQNDLQSIQYELGPVNNEIMLLQSFDDSDLFLQTDTVKPQVDYITDFIMAGILQNHDSDESAVIQIFHESDLVETINVITNSDNEFSIPIKIKDDWKSGIYAAKIVVGEFEMESKTFAVKNKDVSQEIIPEIKSKPAGKLNISQSDVVLEYFPTEIIVSGNVENSKGHSVQLVIDNGEKSISYQLILDENGHFYAPVHIDNTWDLGEYVVQGTYFGKLVDTSVFTIHE